MPVAGSKAQAGISIVKPRAHEMTVNIKIVRITIPIIFKTQPDLIISLMVTYPEPYATAFGGVATGSINAIEHANAAVNIRKYG